MHILRTVLSSFHKLTGFGLAGILVVFPNLSGPCSSPLSTPHNFSFLDFLPDSVLIFSSFILMFWEKVLSLHISRGRILMSLGQACHSTSFTSQRFRCGQMIQFWPNKMFAGRVRNSFCQRVLLLSKEIHDYPFWSCRHGYLRRWFEPLWPSNKHKGVITEGKHLHTQGILVLKDVIKWLG